MFQSAVLEADRPQGPESQPIQFVASVVELLETARDSFERDRETAKASITRATFLMRLELERQSAGPTRDVSAGKLAGWQAQRVRTYVDSHLDETIQVSHLSRIARRSTAHFSRLFKRTFGQTPHAYVTGRRLHRAKTLLLEGSESLSAIALLCGFSDQAHLSKLFRQHTGETPGAWRRRCAFVGAAATLGDARLTAATVLR